MHNYTQRTIQLCNTTTQNSMDEPHKQNVEGKKPERKGYILYNAT